jgi:hypothetical protein
VFIGFVVVMALLFAVGLVGNAALNHYYDLYASRIGGVATRAERDRETQEAIERSPNPLPMFQITFHRDRWEPLAWVYTVAPDEVVEAYRPWARVAMAAYFAWLILAFPIIELVESLVSGRSLPSGWLWFTILRSLSLAVFFSWAIRWVLALLNRASPRRWRLSCLAGMGVALMFFVVFAFIGANSS